LSLKDRIQDDMKAAMRGGDKARLGVIRLLLSAIKQREVDERITLDDAAVMAAIEKMIKQRRDSISQFEAAARQELADAEKAEITILQGYLPAALSDAEIDQIIAEAIAASGAAGPKDMGKVVGLVKPKVQGRADMGAVSGKIKAKLAG
jgi:uncharacterized protein YqeY